MNNISRHPEGSEADRRELVTGDEEHDKTPHIHSQGPDDRAKRSLRMTGGGAMLVIFSLITTYIASVIGSNVGIVIYSSMLTIIMPISCLMLHLEGNVENNETKKALSLFSKLAFLGFILVVASGFMAKEDDVIINNYIPVLNNLGFIGGLSIFLASGFLSSLIAGSNPLRFVFVIAAATLIISYRKIFYEISYPIDLHGYFEMLFLGPASCMSVISILLVYLILQKVLGAGTSIFGTYPPILASIAIGAHHFMSKIDSANFFSLSTIHIQMINLLLVFFIFASLVRYLKTRNLLALISLLSMFVYVVFDLYKADQGKSIEYFNMARNFGITISVMCYLTHILVDGRSNIMRSIKIQFAVYILSSILIMMDFVSNIGQIFASVAVILFAIICIANMIIGQSKLEKK